MCSYCPTFQADTPPSDRGPDVPSTGVQTLLATVGLLALPVVASSLFTLKTTGEPAGMLTGALIQ